jgi:parvulin-like peptidyl-prolyl isomerase
LVCQAVVIDGIAAIVNEDVITISELSAMQSLNLELSGLPSEGSILQDRINHHLVLQQMAKQPPVALTQAEVQAALKAYEEQRGGTEKLMEYLNNIGMNYSDLEREIREQLSIHRYITERFRPFVAITIEEAEKYYNEVYKPWLEDLRREVPSFEESFNEVQAMMVESQVQDKLKEWLAEIRATATINIKG